MIVCLYEKPRHNLEAVLRFKGIPGLVESAKNSIGKEFLLNRHATRELQTKRKEKKTRCEGNHLCKSG